MRFTNLFLGFMGVCVYGCAPNAEPKQAPVQTITAPNVAVSTPNLVAKSAVNSDSIHQVFAKQVLTLLKAKDFKPLATLIHPEEGLRFVPYGFIDTAKSRKCTAQSFLTMATDVKNPTLNWGEYDGTGDPILLTFSAYFAKFVYNADFLNAPQFSVNKVIHSGNSPNNMDKIFQNYQFTESYFAGFDKKLEGMDWTSLRLVFKKKGDKLYLIAIIHGQWTS